MKAAATRHNQGKPELVRLPKAALEEIAQVLMYGATKYPDDADGTPNYKKYWGEDTIRVCLNSALRHAYAMADGEMVDIESGRSHAAHAAINFMFILDYLSRPKTA